MNLLSVLRAVEKKKRVSSGKEADLLASVQRQLIALWQIEEGHKKLKKSRQARGKALEKTPPNPKKVVETERAYTVALTEFDATVSTVLASLQDKEKR